MASPVVDTDGYGSLGAFSAVHQPSRRKKALSIVLAVSSILVCAALVSLGNSRFFGTSHSAELLVTEPSASSEDLPIQPRSQLSGLVENWGNQTPTAMIYARHSPIRDGVVDFYLNLPGGGRRLRAPKWFMGIPVRRRNRAAVLRQVDTAVLQGQITKFPSASTPSTNFKRKLLGAPKSPKKAAPGKSATKGTKGTGKSNPSTKGSGSKSGSGPKSGSSQDSKPAVDCCMPKCAHGTIADQFHPKKGCAACENTIDRNRCSSIQLGLDQRGGQNNENFKECRRLVGNKPVVKGGIYPALFDKNLCKGKVLPPPPPVPLPVPSCAIDKSGKFAGCSACQDPKQFPAADGCICKHIASTVPKPVVGVTVVVRADGLVIPDCLPTAPPPPPPTTKVPGPPVTSSPPVPKNKMCSHDPTKLNGNGQGCGICQGKKKIAATPDLPGNDYWACTECRDKKVCNFNCVQNKRTKVWECNQGPVPVPDPTPRPPPKCMTDKKLKWGESISNEMQCQGYMCKNAGLQPSGEYGPLKYPKINAYPKKLDVKTCCPFVAQGLTSATCKEMFGCEVPFTMKPGQTTWELSDQVQSCKNFFALFGVCSPADWAQKKGNSEFSQGVNKGRSACCDKLLASTSDGKENWCAGPGPFPLPVPPSPEPIQMTAEECQSFLCLQTPMISDVAVTYAVWREETLGKSEGNRRLLAAPSWKDLAKKSGSDAKSGSAQTSASSAAASSKSPDAEDDPHAQVPQCIRLLQLEGIETFETNEECVKRAPIEEEKQEEEEQQGEEPQQEVEGGNEEQVEEHSEEHEHGGESEPELEKEELPESECDEENGPENVPLLPGANVLGYTYDPDFGLEGCNFDRCVIRPFIKFTYKECKVVETPAGLFKVPDQIFAYNLYETSAKTHIYQNEKEEKKAQSADARIEGSYGPYSGKASMSHASSSHSSSKQHIAIRKIDVHLYRLNLVNTKSFNSLVPEFKDAFQALPPRFEDNVHEYIQFLRDWGRYVALSGTFGGAIEVKMKFFSSSSQTKEDTSVGVEMAYSSALVSVGGGVNYGKSNEAKEVENNNEISLVSSGGDPAVGAMISDVHAPETMNFRDDLQKWLESLPKFPRLIEDWPILAVMTKFVPNSPGEDGFDPFTRNQGLLDAMRILHEDGATSLFDKRQCYPPLPPDVKDIPGPRPMPAPKVRIFQHCNFGGATIALAPGDYNSDYLSNPGGYNFVQQISALKIEQGTTVILYSQPGFQGERLVLDKDTSCLTGENFNDLTQSLSIVSNVKTGKIRSGKIANGRNSLQFNDYDRIGVGMCLTFVAETDGDIDAYFFSSPTSQLNAYGFHVKTTAVTLQKGLFQSAIVLKKSTDSDATAFGQSSLPQKVWFCIFPDSEDKSATVFQYGRGSSTLFEYVETSPVNINYFSLGCSTKAATFRSILVIKASRWLEYTNPYNRVCSIVNCEKVQESESSSGTCGCQKCGLGYEPYNNNQECVVAAQCPAQFGCLAATPPECVCEQCCCGLSFDPVSLNCVNANLMMKPGTAVEENIWIAEIPYKELTSMYGPVPTLATRSNVMETKFKPGGSYRMKKVSFACTETNLQNVRVSYDESKPALGFIDYDSTHLVTNSDTAGKFDFSIYDNLRKSVEANPLFSKSGFLNLDEIKLEEVTVASMAKKTGNALKDMFKFVVEGAKQFAKDVDTTVKKTVEKAQQIANDVKAKAQEIAKIADEEAQKFMKVAKKVYNDVATTAQKATQVAVNFVAQNADLLKTLNAVGGAVGGSLVSTLALASNAIPGCQAWCGILIGAVGGAAVAATTAAGDGLVNMAVSAKASGQNPLAFLTEIDVPADIKKAAIPLLEKTMSGVNMDDLKQFASSGAQGQLMDSVLKDGFSSAKAIFDDPGIQKIGNDVAGSLLNQGAQLIGKLPVDQIAEQGLKMASPLLDKVLPGSGAILGTASKMLLPTLGKLGGLFGKKRALLEENSDLAIDSTQGARGRRLLFKLDWPIKVDVGKLGQDLANKANQGMNALKGHIEKAGDAVKSTVTDAVDKIGDVHKNIAGGLDKALGTDMFSKASNAVHSYVGGAIKDTVNGLVDAGTGHIIGAINSINDRVSSILDPNKAKREYMNSQEYKDKMAAKAIFQTFSTKLGLPSDRMPKYLTDSIVQWIMGEMKVTPLTKQPFLTNLNAENQCVSAASPETCTEGDIKCIVLANKCFLDDEGCVKAALSTIPTIFLEKYAAANHLDFAGSSYGRYIRISAPTCNKRALSLIETPRPGAKRLLLQSEGEAENSDSEPVQNSDSEPVQDHVDTTSVDVDALFAKQPTLVFGLNSKFWKQPQLISFGATGQQRLVAGRRLSRGMQIISSNGKCRAVLQGDGNFVIYKDFMQAIWSTQTSDIYVMYLSSTGNLCGYRTDMTVAWGCGTSGTNNAELVMQDDCNLVLYRDKLSEPSSGSSFAQMALFMASRAKNVAWQSGTNADTPAAPAPPTRVVEQPSLFPLFHAAKRLFSGLFFNFANIGGSVSSTSSSNPGMGMLQHVQNQMARMQKEAAEKKENELSVLSDLRDTVFKAAKPDFQGQVANLNFQATDKAFAGSPMTSEFLAQFSGNIFVPITGSWTFFLTSDDGSRLYIDGSQVIDNDGFHGMVEATGSAVLTRGMHTIDVSFFQGGGGAGLTLAWSGPNIAKQIIPKEYFLLNSKDVPLSLPREQGCLLDNTLQVSQIAVFDPFGTNVALNKPCDTSNPLISNKLMPYLPAGPQNVYPSFIASCARAVDGNLANRNGNEIFQSTEPDSDTVTFDLGKNVLIKRIMYWNRKDCCQNMIAGATLEVLNEKGEVVNTQVFTNKLVQAFNFPVSQSRATLFTDCNYGGDQVAMGPGNYRLSMMQIPKNSLSAIKLPQDLEIKLFAGENFDGKFSPWIQADVPCLDGRDFNDQTGSIQIRERSKLNSMSSNEVLFYDKCDFRGVSMTLNPGTYTASELSLTRNSIMSVKVPAELEVQLYSFDNFGGRSSGWLQKSYTCLTDIDFSRTTVSIQIRKRTKAKKRGLLSDEEYRTELIEKILPHAGQYASYMPKNGDSESSRNALRLAVEIAHHGAHLIAESHQDHREMLASIAKWVPHQYVLSALKMDLEQSSATSPFAHTAMDTVHKSLFTQLTQIADTTAQTSLNLLDQMVVNMLSTAYSPVTLPAPCFSSELIMSYLPDNLQSGIDTWLEMDKFSWIQEIRVDSVDALLRDSRVVQADKYSVTGLSFKISQYKRESQDSNEYYYLVRGIETRYQKTPSFGGPGDSISAFIGKSKPDKEDDAVITDCDPVNFGEGEFLISMAVVIIPEGLGGINTVLTNKRTIALKCGQKPSSSSELASDDGVEWINCDVGYDPVGIGGKFDTRVMRTVELKCSPTSQADRVQFLGVYSYSFVTHDFFNGLSSAPGSGYRAGFWGAGSEVGITRKQDANFADGWVLRIWTNRVPPISPVTGVAPLGIKSSSWSRGAFDIKVSEYGRIESSDSLTKAMAPPGDPKWMFDSSQVQYTDIVQLTFAEDTKDNSIRGVYVHYSAWPSLYSGFVLNSETSYKNLRMKNLNLQKNEYWTGLKVGLDPATGAISCITGVKTSLREYGILCGSRESSCLKKAGWIDCPTNTPLMVALQEDFNSNNQLIGLMPICASMKATRFEVNEFTVQLAEDEFINSLHVKQGDWTDAITQVGTNKRSIPMQCGLYQAGPGVRVITMPSQFTEKTVKKGRAAIGFRTYVATSDQFGVFADTSAVSAISNLQKQVNKNKLATDDQVLKMQQTSKGPGPTIIRLSLQAMTYDSDPLSAFIMEAPEEAGRSRIPDFEASGVYREPTFDMAFDFYKPRLGQFFQIRSLDFQCQRAKSTAKDFWMPWFQLSFTNGETFSQGEKSTDRLAVAKSLPLSAEEYMVRIELSSHKDKGYAITAIKTNKKYYPFKCGATAVGLDVPVVGDGTTQKDLIIGFAGNVQTSADGHYFTNLQALHLKLNAFASEPSALQVNQ